MASIALTSSLLRPLLQLITARIPAMDRLLSFLPLLIVSVDASTDYNYELLRIIFTPQNETAYDCENITSIQVLDRKLQFDCYGFIEPFHNSTMTAYITDPDAIIPLQSTDPLDNLWNISMTSRSFADYLYLSGEINQVTERDYNVSGLSPQLIFVYVQWTADVVFSTTVTATTVANNVTTATAASSTTPLENTTTSLLTTTSGQTTTTLNSSTTTSPTTWTSPAVTTLSNDLNSTGSPAATTTVPVAITTPLAASSTTESTTRSTTTTSAATSTTTSAASSTVDPCNCGAGSVTLPPQYVYVKDSRSFTGILVFAMIELVLLLALTVLFVLVRFTSVGARFRHLLMGEVRRRDRGLGVEEPSPVREQFSKESGHVVTTTVVDEQPIVDRVKSPREEEHLTRRTAKNDYSAPISHRKAHAPSPPREQSPLPPLVSHKRSLSVAIEKEHAQRNAVESACERCGLVENENWRIAKRHLDRMESALEESEPVVSGHPPRTQPGLLQGQPEDSPNTVSSALPDEKAPPKRRIFTVGSRSFNTPKNSDASAVEESGGSDETTAKNGIREEQPKPDQSQNLANPISGKPPKAPTDPLEDADIYGDWVENCLPSYLVVWDLVSRPKIYKTQGTSMVDMEVGSPAVGEDPVEGKYEVPVSRPSGLAPLFVPLQEQPSTLSENYLDDTNIYEEIPVGRRSSHHSSADLASRLVTPIAPSEIEEIPPELPRSPPPRKRPSYSQLSKETTVTVKEAEPDPLLSAEEAAPVLVRPVDDGDSWQERDSLIGEATSLTDLGEDDAASYNPMIPIYGEIARQDSVTGSHANQAPSSFALSNDSDFGAASLVEDGPLTSDSDGYQVVAGEADFLADFRDFFN